MRLWLYPKFEKDICVRDGRGVGMFYWRRRRVVRSGLRGSGRSGWDQGGPGVGGIVRRLGRAG